MLQADAGVCNYPGESKAAEWQAPDLFKRQTTKYWCKPEHVVQLKVAIIKHLPVLVYGQRTKLAAGINHIHSIDIAFKGQILVCAYTHSVLQSVLKLFSDCFIDCWQAAYSST
jgi:SPX domain protein involved in polyphosphate accumulation